MRGIPSHLFLYSLFLSPIFYHLLSSPLFLLFPSIILITIYYLLSPQLPPFIPIIPPYLLLPFIVPYLLLLHTLPSLPSYHPLCYHFLFLFLSINQYSPLHYLFTLYSIIPIAFYYLSSLRSTLLSLLHLLPLISSLLHPTISNYISSLCPYYYILCSLLSLLSSSNICHPFFNPFPLFFPLLISVSSINPSFILFQSLLTSIISITPCSYSLG